MLCQILTYNLFPNIPQPYMRPICNTSYPYVCGSISLNPGDLYSNQCQKMTVFCKNRHFLVIIQFLSDQCDLYFYAIILIIYLPSIEIRIILLSMNDGSKIIISMIFDENLEFLKNLNISLFDKKCIKMAIFMLNLSFFM